MSKPVQMKHVFVVWLAFFLISAFSPAASPAETGGSLTILYTGSVKGVIEPVSG